VKAYVFAILTRPVTMITRGYHASGANTPQRRLRNIRNTPKTCDNLKFLSVKRILRCHGATNIIYLLRLANATMMPYYLSWRMQLSLITGTNYLVSIIDVSVTCVIAGR